MADSRRDRNLEHGVALMRQQLVGLLNGVQLEPMRHKRTQIGTLRGDHRHQPTHSFLAAGAQCGDDLVVAEAGGKWLKRNFQVAGIDAKACRRERCAPARRKWRLSSWPCLFLPCRARNRFVSWCRHVAAPKLPLRRSYARVPRLNVARMAALPSRGAARQCSQAAEPVVSLVLPIAAEILVGDVEGGDVLGVLEAELGRDTDLHGEAVLDR